LGIGDRGQSRDVRNQIGLNKIGGLGVERAGAQSADSNARHQKSLWKQISHVLDPPSQD
jgi:hypothetical protein